MIHGDLLGIALVLILGQGGIVYMLLRLVRTFGGYTDVLLRTHESNVLLREATLKSIETMRALYNAAHGCNEEVA